MKQRKNLIRFEVVYKVEGRMTLLPSQKDNESNSKLGLAQKGVSNKTLLADGQLLTS